MQKLSIIAAAGIMAGCVFEEPPNTQDAQIQNVTNVTAIRVAEINLPIDLPVQSPNPFDRKALFIWNKYFKRRRKFDEVNEELKKESKEAKMYLEK